MPINYVVNKDDLMQSNSNRRSINQNNQSKTNFGQHRRIKSILSNGSKETDEFRSSSLGQHSRIPLTTPSTPVDPKYGKTGTECVSGPNIFGHVLGPTVDEPILFGLEAFLKMCDECPPRELPQTGERAVVESNEEVRNGGNTQDKKQNSAILQEMSEDPMVEPSISSQRTHNGNLNFKRNSAPLQLTENPAVESSLSGSSQRAHNGSYDGIETEEEFDSNRKSLSIIEETESEDVLKYLEQEQNKGFESLRDDSALEPEVQKEPNNLKIENQSQTVKPLLESKEFQTRESLNRQLSEFYKQFELKVSTSVEESNKEKLLEEEDMPQYSRLSFRRPTVQETQQDKKEEKQEPQSSRQSYRKSILQETQQDKKEETQRSQSPRQSYRNSILQETQQDENEELETPRQSYRKSTVQETEAENGEENQEPRLLRQSYRKSILQETQQDENEELQTPRQSYRKSTVQDTEAENGEENQEPRLLRQSPRQSYRKSFGQETQQDEKDENPNLESPRQSYRKSVVQETQQDKKDENQEPELPRPSYRKSIVQETQEDKREEFESQSPRQSHRKSIVYGTQQDETEENQESQSPRQSFRKSIVQETQEDKMEEKQQPQSFRECYRKSTVQKYSCKCAGESYSKKSACRFAYPSSCDCKVCTRSGTSESSKLGYGSNIPKRRSLVDSRRYDRLSQMSKTLSEESQSLSSEDDQSAISLKEKVSSAKTENSSCYKRRSTVDSQKYRRKSSQVSKDKSKESEGLTLEDNQSTISSKSVKASEGMRISNYTSQELVPAGCLCSSSSTSTASEYDAENSGKGDCQLLDLRYAITKISKFKNYTTFEVMKSTRKRPKVIPKTLEGVFVLRNRKK